MGRCKFEGHGAVSTRQCHFTMAVMVYINSSKFWKILCVCERARNVRAFLKKCLVSRGCDLEGTGRESLSHSDRRFQVNCLHVT